MFFKSEQSMMQLRYYRHRRESMQMLLAKSSTPGLWVDEKGREIVPAPTEWDLIREFESENWEKAKDFLASKYGKASNPWYYNPFTPIEAEAYVEEEASEVEIAPENWHRIEFTRFTFPNGKYLEVPAAYVVLNKEKLFCALFGMSEAAADYIWLVVSEKLPTKTKRDIIARSDNDAIYEALVFMNTVGVSKQIIPKE